VALFAAAAESLLGADSSNAETAGHITILYDAFGPQPQSQSGIVKRTWRSSSDGLDGSRCQSSLIAGVLRQTERHSVNPVPKAT